MASNKKESRTVLFIRCSVEQAEKIRRSAKEADRTISAHVLSIVMRQLDIKKQVNEQVNRNYDQWLRQIGLRTVSGRKRPV